ncbi:DJ-1/PfpI family protein [Piscirickettsia litoralis]|uniref:DJ-1/PfpI domain-containing protein n=1 Tax=Piscirickettsia litoralis TaxID=1891921 RepID=A0ABX3ABQ2_9GAMM|nr:DJ-1/PfpI family protein [Piscirickettsia litoralis]ODN43544.1 hypothetical protein BGC07_12235 [Piscirickettsia litoralis]
MEKSLTLKLAVLLYDGFELLDVFGPLEVFGQCDNQFEISLIGENEIIQAYQGQRLVTDYKLDDNTEKFDVILVPGGLGSRQQIYSSKLGDWLIKHNQAAQYILSVCTGAVFLAQYGLLSNKRATTNKMAMDWVMEFGENIHWQKKARWVVDGQIWTSSGVSAGIDMSLAFVAELFGFEYAKAVADKIEYVWNADSDCDPFYLHGL